MSTNTRIPIARDLLTERMHDLRHTERALVRDADISTFALRTARREGWLPGTFTLADLMRLADALGLSLSDLVPNDTPATHREPDEQAEHDAETVIPHLVGHTAIPAINIAKAFGWDRQRLQACLSAIPTALEGTGLRYIENNGQVRVEPHYASDPNTRAAIRRLRATSRPMTRAEATTLARILDGDNVQSRQMANNTRVVLGALKNLGCIELNDEAIYEATDALHTALPDL